MDVNCEETVVASGAKGMAQGPVRDRWEEMVKEGFREAPREGHEVFF